MRPRDVDDFRIRESGVPGWGTGNHGIVPFIRLRRGAGAGLGTAILLALLLFSGVAAVAALKWPSETRRAIEIAKSVGTSAAADLGLSPADEVTSASTPASIEVPVAQPVTQPVAPSATAAETQEPDAPARAQPIPQRVHGSKPVAVRRDVAADWKRDGELHLFVVDDENRPVPSARVRVVSVMENSATTPFDDFADEFGRVSVGPLGAGYVAITVERDTVRRTTRAVIEPGLRTDVTIAQPEGAAVIGVVRDADGRPVAGVAVRSAPRPRAPAVEGVAEDTFSAVSDEAGIYRLVDVPIGDHELIVVDGASPDGPQRHRLDVPHRGTLTCDLATATRAASQLSMDLPNSAGVARGTLSSDTLSVAGARMSTNSVRQGVRRKTTALPGRTGAIARTTLPAPSSDNDASVRFQLTDERGEPYVGDVTLAMLPQDGGRNGRTTNLTVYGRGTATFHEAVSGAYRISLRAPGHQPATLLSTVEPGRNEIRVVLPRLPDPPARYVLEGTVVDRTTGRALPGCKITMRGHPDEFCTTTRDGRFAIDSPDERPKGVWVTRDGYESELVIAPVKGPVEVRLAPRAE